MSAVEKAEVLARVASSSVPKRKALGCIWSLPAEGLDWSVADLRSPAGDGAGQPQTAVVTTPRAD